jgi:hypothetical protein
MEGPLQPVKSLSRGCPVGTAKHRHAAFKRPGMAPRLAKNAKPMNGRRRTIQGKNRTERQLVNQK